MVAKDELTKKWDRILDSEKLGLIEKNNRIYPQVISVDSESIARRKLKAEAVKTRRDQASSWLENHRRYQLETIRKGPGQGKPQLVHKRILELFAEGYSTREISSELKKQGEDFGYQGVAKVLSRYLGAA